jgi:hypothetical protein
MRSRVLLALLLAFALALPAYALAREGSGGSGSGDPDDSGPGASGNATGDAAEHGNRSGHGPGEAGEARRDARDAFHGAMEACEELNDTARAGCMRNATQALRAVEAEAHEQAESEEDNISHEGRPEDRLGHFNLASGSFDGRFVDFAWDGSTRCVEDYTVSGVLVWDTICLEGGEPGAEVELSEHGRVVEVKSGDAKLRLHDNPRGTIAGGSGHNGTLVFALNAALDAGLRAQNHTLNITGPGNFTAALHADNMTWAGGGATVHGHASFIAHDRDVALPEVANEHRHDIEAAKDRRHVGAEVTVAGPDDDDVDEEVLDEHLEVDVTHGTEDGGRVRVEVNATGLGPQTIVVNVAAGLLRGDHVVVTYYDEADGTLKEVPIVEADSLADVLDPTDDSTPEYWVVHDSDGVQVLVSVPHFSLHVFDVQGALGELPPSVLAGALGAVLFVAAAGTGLLVRRKQR